MEGQGSNSPSAPVAVEDDSKLQILQLRCIIDAKDREIQLLRQQLSGQEDSALNAALQDDVNKLLAELQRVNQENAALRAHLISKTAEKAAVADTRTLPSEPATPAASAANSASTTTGANSSYASPQIGAARGPTDRPQGLQAPPSGSPSAGSIDVGALVGKLRSLVAVLVGEALAQQQQPSQPQYGQLPALPCLPGPAAVASPQQPVEAHLSHAAPPPPQQQQPLVPPWPQPMQPVPPQQAAMGQPQNCSQHHAMTETASTAAAGYGPAGPYRSQQPPYALPPPPLQQQQLAASQRAPQPVILGGGHPYYDSDGIRVSSYSIAGPLPSPAAALADNTPPAGPALSTAPAGLHLITQHASVSAAAAPPAGNVASWLFGPSIAGLGAGMNAAPAVVIHAYPPTLVAQPPPAPPSPCPLVGQPPPAGAPAAEVRQAGGAASAAGAATGAPGALACGSASTRVSAPSSPADAGAGAHVASVVPAVPAVLELNVDGTLVYVERAVLEAQARGSKLYETVVQQYHRLPTDSHGRPYLSYDPVVFQVLLAILKERSLFGVSAAAGDWKRVVQSLGVSVSYFEQVASHFGILDQLPEPARPASPPLSPASATAAAAAAVEPTRASSPLSRRVRSAPGRDPSLYVQRPLLHLASPLELLQQFYSQQGQQAGGPSATSALAAERGGGGVSQIPAGIVGDSSGWVGPSGAAVLGGGGGGPLGGGGCEAMVLADLRDDADEAEVPLDALRPPPPPPQQQQPWHQEEDQKSGSLGALPSAAPAAAGSEKGTATEQGRCSPLLDVEAAAVSAARAVAEEALAAAVTAAAGADAGPAAVVAAAAVADAGPAAAAAEAFEASTPGAQCKQPVAAATDVPGDTAVAVATAKVPAAGDHGGKPSRASTPPASHIPLLMQQQQQQQRQRPQQRHEHAVQALFADGAQQPSRQIPAACAVGAQSAAAAEANGPGTTAAGGAGLALSGPLQGEAAGTASTKPYRMPSLYSLLAQKNAAVESRD